MSESFFRNLAGATPAIVMAAGVSPMLSPTAPEHVRYGGACLMGIAAILADLNTNKKLGYTDKIVAALKKIPGMKETDEGTCLGLLCYSACTFLAGGEAINIASDGYTNAGALKIAYNTINYPLGGAMDFKALRELAEKMLGKEIQFSFRDVDGEIQKTAPIPTARLLQQLAFLSGAGGIITYGKMLDVPSIQFTGLMFAISNGLSIANLFKPPISENIQQQVKGIADSGSAGTKNIPSIIQQLAEETGQGGKTIEINSLGEIPKAVEQLFGSKTQRESFF